LFELAELEANVKLIKYLEPLAIDVVYIAPPPPPAAEHEVNEEEVMLNTVRFPKYTAPLIILIMIR
jgi:hypothetical protein